MKSFFCNHSTVQFVGIYVTHVYKHATLHLSNVVAWCFFDALYTHVYKMERIYIYIYIFNHCTTMGYQWSWTKSKSFRALA